MKLLVAQKYEKNYHPPTTSYLRKIIRHGGVQLQYFLLFFLYITMKFIQFTFLEFCIFYSQKIYLASEVVSLIVCMVGGSTLKLYLLLLAW
jgi:hypothetical protein